MRCVCWHMCVVYVRSVCGCCSGNTPDVNPEVGVSVSPACTQSHDSSFFMAFPPLFCEAARAGDEI